MLKDYLENCGAHCIYCRSESIEAEHVDVEGASAYQNVTCNGCGGSWDDYYTLTDVTSFKPGSVPLEKPEQYDAPAWETYKAVALNVVHLDADSREYLDYRGYERESNRILKRDTGWFLKLSGLIEDGNVIDVTQQMPETLRAIVALAVAHNAGIIEFDSDANTVGGLPTFETDW